jgi:hypothetical protein
VARPRKKIDPRKVKQLAGAGLTVAEIAAFLDCSKDTLERRFAASLKEGRERLNASLKRKQFIVAMGGNPTMLIWLGKQYLGQEEKVSATIRGKATPTDPEQQAAAEAALKAARKASGTQRRTGRMPGDS